MNTVRVMLCGFSALSIAGAALAQSPSDEAQKDRLFRQADANGDGVIDRREFSAAVNLMPSEGVSSGASAPAERSAAPGDPSLPEWVPLAPNP